MKEWDGNFVCKDWEWPRFLHSLRHPTFHYQHFRFNFVLNFDQFLIKSCQCSLILPEVCSDIVKIWPLLPKKFFFSYLFNFILNYVVSIVQLRPPKKSSAITYGVCNSTYLQEIHRKCHTRIGWNFVNLVLNHSKTHKYSDIARNLNIYDS